MHTTQDDLPAGRRRRRQYSAEFKSELVTACRQPGISIASVALAHGLNANLLRRWITEHERSAVTAPHVPTWGRSAQYERSAGFVPVAVAPTTAPEEFIRVELQRGATTMTITWPTSAAADCAAWMRELLR